MRLEDRRAYAAAHTLKRLVLAAVTRLGPDSLVFYDDAHGKPCLDGQSGVHFNLSHTHGMVAFACSRAMEVGVDVEYLGSEIYDRAVAAMTLNTDEIRSVERATNPHRAFLFYWTAKEAAMKAEGKGMSMPMRDIHVFNGAAKTHSKHWSVWHYLPSERHILAFAMRATTGVDPAYPALPCLFIEEAALWQWAENGNPPPCEKLACLEPQIDFK